METDGFLTPIISIPLHVVGVIYCRGGVLRKVSSIKLDCSKT